MMSLHTKKMKGWEEEEKWRKEGREGGGMKERREGGGKEVRKAGQGPNGFTVEFHQNFKKEVPILSQSSKRETYSPNLFLRIA